MMAGELLEFETRTGAARAVVAMVTSALEKDIEECGRAVFLSSGGSTPKETLEELSKASIKWSAVEVGLVDERQVSDEHEASNARLVKNALLKNEAAASTFIPMYSKNAELAVEVYEALMPASMILLGMGTDGHTASWFSGAASLNDAISDSEQILVAIDAAGCPVAGEITDRLTLTRHAINQSRKGVLMIFGEEKRDVLSKAMSAPVEEAPIRAAVEDLGDRLTIVWAP